ncbi:methyl-accepting chemotaxis protein [Halanaerobium praevalens]|uniref:Methyl-accepting chemotaxis sensory transducer n=1 Tax=Halanaerobium praevalens (strain ATCC 33744 / DSM 2228 / GSL) TaxID=572479 RepID=E3DM42_HALPG|nr:methyl-accepting chemotaxis protein [Halanaerobium praevalens]ADO77320.1 methyl-accepting chemotaxis sensory transducer [Halanaerobium praevalens DSM 2228]
MKIIKKLTLKTELYFVFAFIILILVGLGAGGLYAINQVHFENQKSISKWKNINFISEKENEHLVWVHELNKAINSNSQFEGELDYTNCSFRETYFKIINSDEFTKMPAQIQKVLKDIEKPHKNLHDSAAKINATLEQKTFSSEAKALKIFKNETMTSLNQLQSLFNEYKSYLENQAVANVDQVGTNVEKMRNYIITALALILILISLFVYFFTRRINKSLAKTINLADNIAAGNLQVNNLELKRDDEIAKLAKALNKMKNNIKFMISDIDKIANNLFDSSGKLSTSSQEVTERSKKVGASIAEVAAGSEKQSTQVKRANKSIKELDQEINEVENNSQAMDAQANQAIDNIAEGNENINKSIDKIKSVKDNSHQTAQDVNNLGELSNKIGDIVELINKIAEQTNLLALNAAIEAARAGEAGRGFSVVADEIRELAEESATATDQINNLIKRIQKSVNNAVGKMKANEEVVDASVEVIVGTGKSFAKIKEATLKLSNLIENISSKTSKISQNSKAVKLTIEEIAAVSKTSVTKSDEVAQTSTEQINSTQEIVKGTDNLAEMAAKLKKAINQFSL